MKITVKINKFFDQKNLKYFFEFYHVAKENMVKYDLNKILTEGEILTLEVIEKINYIPQIYNLDILYEDDYLLIINKPANLIIYPTPEIQNNTLVNYVAYHYYQTKFIANVRYCHRLDFDTTGIIVFAKNFFVHSYLNYLWEEKQIKRTYLAIAENNFKNKEGIIDEPIARDRHSPPKRRVSKTGKKAITEYKVLKKIKNYNLVSLTLKTGRTHQIRVHLSHINHPILGDQLYNKKSSLINRTALHSYKLEMLHPITFEKLLIKCPLPLDMQKIVGEFND